MKRILFIMGMVFSAFVAFAQNPVNFEYKLKKIDVVTYEVHLTAEIDEGWHLYAQLQPQNAAAQPTTVTFNPNESLTFSGPVKEFGDKETYNNETIGVTQYQYSNKVDFVQVVKLKSKGTKANVTGAIKYQVCNEDMCLPLRTIQFAVSIQ